MPPEEDYGAERPKAVTIIGRLWLVVAVFYLGKALVNLAVWRVLEPDAATLFGDITGQLPKLWFLRPLLAHLTALMAAQALWWAFVGIAAFSLLRLRPWARVAMQGVCWTQLVYFAGFGTLWATVWPTQPVSGESAPAFSAISNRTVVFIGGLAVFAVAATGLITVIVLLRTPKVREAFERSRVVTQEQRGNQER